MVPGKLLLLCCLFLVFTAHFTAANYQNSLVIQIQDKNNVNTSEEAFRSSYFMYYADGSIWRFPDLTTFDAILHDLHKNISVFTTPIAKMLLNVNVAELKDRPLLPSLQPTGNTWEEHLRVKLSRALILEKNDFLDMNSIIRLPKINPGHVLFNKRVLLCWRENNRIAFGWMDKSNTQLDENIEYLGLGGPNHRFPLQSNKTQEDPRLFRLSDNSILLTFVTTEVVGPNKLQSTYCYAFIKYSKERKGLQFGLPVAFDSELDTQQKNWLPLEANHTIHFLHTLVPNTRILKLLGHTADHVAVSEDLKMHTFTLSNGSVHTYSNKIKHKEVPWKMKYGEVIHGGTPTLRVNEQLHLLFFHSTDFRQHPWNIFFGAATLCANNINIVHSMSAFPIAKSELYKGKGFNKRVAYIVFPMGLDWSATDTTHETITVSMGLQDAHGMLVNMKLKPLLESLTVMHDCSGNDMHNLYHNWQQQQPQQRR